LKTPLSYNKDFAFNAICPYYTMFPLEYPLRIIRKHRQDDPVILDPFCGRGTTIYAARKLGLTSHGFDTSPIAAAIARAKLASATLEDVLALGEALIAKPPKHVPQSAFFKRAFEKRTLVQLCSLREGLLTQDRPSNASAILRAAALGCLHGPMLKGEGVPSYFSNQMPRTFASKPDYSLQFWKDRDLFPPVASVMEVIRKKLERINDLESDSFGRLSNVHCSDSRRSRTFRNVKKASLTITSPPYYGMRTYVQDQWLRMWFMGGPEDIDYESHDQLCHTGHEAFIVDLAKVWKNVHKHSKRGAHLYVRFGSLPSAESDAKSVLRRSLERAGGWTLVSVRNAATSEAGKRQANQMGRESEASEEYDFHAIRS
jgi:hypothetical protein